MRDEGSRKPDRCKTARVQFTKVDLRLAKGKPKDSSLDTGSGTILFEGSFDLSVFQWLSWAPVVHHQVFRFALCVEVKGTEFRYLKDKIEDEKIINKSFTVVFNYVFVLNLEIHSPISTVPCCNVQNLI